MAQPEPSSSTIAVAHPRPTNTSKLRQTCDPCSEAKVKCDKTNPRCGRCDRLGYNCVYRPARRIGRPRPRSRRSSGHNAGEHPAEGVRDSESGEKEQSAQASVPAATPATSPSALDPTQPVQRRTPTARVPNHLNLDIEEHIPDYLSNEARWSAHVISKGSASTRASSNEHSSNTSMRVGLSSSNLERSSLDRHNSYEQDCSTVAVATLGKLAAAGLDSQLTAATAADVLADQIPQACRQVARILVCPCSTDMDTALLIASLALAILEVTDSALRTLKPAGHALDDAQHTVLALGAFPSISQVVTLFTHRYSVSQAGSPLEPLLSLAVSLRTKLKTLAEESTNRFLDSGAASVTA